MLDPVGFWSYARQDDAHSDGQLSQLRAIVGKAIVLQCGVEVTLWQDIAAIPYGADWAETIERTIGQTTFFIPIVTPRFLKSQFCRDEFVTFRQRMQRLGRNDLIFPVHYVSVDGMRSEETVFGDDLAALRRSQWIDFRPLFYADPKSPEVRRWAGDFAGSILKALRQPETARTTGRAPSRAAPSATAAERVEEAPLAAQRPAPNVALAAPEEPEASLAPTRGAPARPREATPASQNLGPPPAVPAPGGLSHRGLLIAGFAVLVGVIAAGVGLIPMEGPSWLAQGLSWLMTSPTPTPTSVASPAKDGACDGSGAGLASLASRTPGALSAAEACALKPKDVFRECTDCPAMVVLPPGSFTMGSPASEPGRFASEDPQHEVRIAKPFAVAQFQVTVDEFKAFVTATGYDAGSACYAWDGASFHLQSGHSWRDPGFAQTGSHPAACLNWNDAQAYAKWLSGKTGKAYRLPSEAEWEYAARGRTEPGNYPRYFFGDLEADFCKYGNGADQPRKCRFQPPRTGPYCRATMATPIRHRRDHSGRTILACSTCMAMCGSGYWIATMRIT